MGTHLSWAAIDFETTGIHPGAHHRVVEVAVVSGTGATVTDEWTTLIHPERDIGAGEVHGLFGRDLREAPRFGEIAGTLLDRIRGRVLVAHNATFDRGFLVAELRRLGIELPALPWQCTLALSRRLGVPSGRLADCCARLGVRGTDPHTALGDARACAQLFTTALRRLDLGSPTAVPDLPLRPATAAPVGRRQPPTPGTSWLADLVAARPILAAANLSIARYLEVLDRVLEDRLVTCTEASELGEVAGDLGLEIGHLREAHGAYLAALVAQAWADGVVTDRECRDLDRVRELLCIEATPSAGAAGPARTEDLAGRSVCFTGTLHCSHRGRPITREHAHSLATTAGLIPAKRVTKSLDILVVADPDTASGKARQARSYGTRLIAEAAFWPLIGIEVA